MDKFSPHQDLVCIPISSFSVEKHSVYQSTFLEMSVFTKLLLKLSNIFLASSLSFTLDTQGSKCIDHSTVLRTLRCITFGVNLSLGMKLSLFGVKVISKKSDVKEGGNFFGLKM